MEEIPDVNLAEIRRYIDRIEAQWALDAAWLGGARVDDARGLGAQRERGPEFVVVLVSRAFGDMPWLERVYQAANLWNADAMGARVDVHCYTPSELERRNPYLKWVKAALERGVNLIDGAGAS